MITRPFLRELYRHMEWADAAVWAAVPLDGLPDARLRLLLVHVHTVQRAFLAIWKGRPVQEGFRNPEDFGSLDEVRAWAQPVYNEAHSFLDTVDDDGLAAPLEPPWARQIEAKL